MPKYTTSLTMKLLLTFFLFFLPTLMLTCPVLLPHLPKGQQHHRTLCNFSSQLNQHVVHSAQPSDLMPETTSFNICSNLSTSDDCVVGLDKNLDGYGGGHGVTGCNHSSVAGNQQSEAASLSIFWSTTLSEQYSQH